MLCDFQILMSVVLELITVNMTAMIMLEVTPVIVILDILWMVVTAQVYTNIRRK